LPNIKEFTTAITYLSILENFIQYTYALPILKGFKCWCCKAGELYGKMVSEGYMH